MISVYPPRLTSGPQPAHDARPHPHRVFMQQRQGYLWISSGDRQKFTPTQDMQTNLGKVLRLALSTC